MTELLLPIASEIISAGLAFVLVYFFFRAYRLTKLAYLLGLPFGFSFLGVSYISLGVSMIYERSSVSSIGSLWLYLVTQTYGFAFVTISYYFSRKMEEKAKHILKIVSLASAISIFLILLGLYLAPPSLGLPSNDVADEGFRIANLVFLVYVIYTLVKNWESSRRPISRSMWASSAFSLLAIGQYSQLIHDIDGSQTAFIFAHILRIASLLVLIYIYYVSGKGEG